MASECLWSQRRTSLVHICKGGLPNLADDRFLQAAFASISYAHSNPPWDEERAAMLCPFPADFVAVRSPCLPLAVLSRI